MSNLMAFGASDGIQVSVRASTSSRWSAMTSWMSAAFCRAERAFSRPSAVEEPAVMDGQFR